MPPTNDNNRNRTSSPPPFFNEVDISINEFERLCAQAPNRKDFPFSIAIEKNVPVYEGEQVRNAIARVPQTRDLEREWCRCLGDGPGVFVVRQAYSDLAVLDSMTDVFRVIIAEEKSTGSSKGDHFGNNERIWNSFQKSFVQAPKTAIDYYGNSILALASRSWLGPHYQISAQVNIVKPGSEAQSPHRDYHLGFQSDSTIGRFPAHAQVMSQYLTLQGGIAHSDMPLESGPTLLLPYSHQYAMGYMAFRKPEFIEFFQAKKIQLPLGRGDAIFFNPALYHGAGSNSSKADRIGNLVQISSAFGRTMETIDHRTIAEAAYPVLLAKQQGDPIPENELTHVLSAVAEGYSFPTNLDSDPPIDGNAPRTMQQLLRDALDGNWPLEKLKSALDEYSHRRRA